MTDRDPHNSRGVIAGKSTLFRITAIALLLALAPLLAGFGYLALLREPQLESRHIQTISAMVARQQATSLSTLLQDLDLRLQQAARATSWQRQLGEGADPEALAATLLPYFPEFSELRLIPLTDVGTATLGEGNYGLRNHIEVDLVRRAATGEGGRPEAYTIDGEQFTVVAFLAPNRTRGESRTAVLCTLRQQGLIAHLQTGKDDLGAVVLEQMFGNNRSELLRTGQSGTDGLPYRAVQAVPDTAWQVSFTPSDTLVAELDASRLPLLLVLGVMLGGVCAGLLTVILWLPRLVGRDVARIIDSAGLKTRLHLDIPHLVPLGQHLRGLLAGQTTAPANDDARPTPPAVLTGHHLTNPLFQRDTILDSEASEDEESLELELGEESAEPVTAELLPQHIFRAYDIRGKADSELGDTAIGLIGSAIGSLVTGMNQDTLVVGCDGRTSSPRIKRALIHALLDTGCRVIDIGVVPTPLLYYATRKLTKHSGIMVTGSHNPAADNGLKIVLDHYSVAGGLIQQIRERALAGDFSEGQGSLSQADPLPDYLDEVVGDIALTLPLKLVIDAGNGATSELAPRLFSELGCEVVPLFCDIDGDFPNRSPDTSREDNLGALVTTVVREKADLGIAFDGDGDRLAVVTSSGQILRTDQLMMLYVQDVVSRHPGTDVVFDIKCSRNLSRLVVDHGGRPVLSKTGHAFMKEKMVETGALLGGEFSGHIFFGERWYGFDDGLYAAARLVEIISNQGDSLDQLMSVFPQTANTPEILIPVPEATKFALIEKFIENASFPEGKTNTLDGLRVDFSDGWGLIRASNTSPALTARFEASSPEQLQLIMDTFRVQLAAIAPGLEIPD
ncbi:MAG: phosphomannomutase/phosphoglucomutase [Haliea sp.]|uniref:phosphomannomutase/phosphoglucomutase n=1 Tax=Haliea sp. TaxID=1932666 RepID=UPI0032ED0211